MKSLRVYFVMSLVWLLASLALVACSDKKSSSNTCPTGMASYNGYCSYDPNYPNGGGGLGGGGTGGYGYSPNGQITNSGLFRDLNNRIFNYNYYCSYDYNGCNSLQIRIQPKNSTEYTMYMASPSLGTGGGGTTVALQATKFVYNGQTQVIMQVYEYNPTPFVILELVMTSGLNSASTSYSLNYKTNASNSTGTTIATGTMRKNIDY